MPTDTPLPCVTLLELELLATLLEITVPYISMFAIRHTLFMSYLWRNQSHLPWKPKFSLISPSKHFMAMPNMAA
jgi:hypothetical protein